MRQKILRKVETYHELVHFLFGVMISLYIHHYNLATSYFILLIIGVFFSLAPDLDHIIYWFTYGKATEYSLIVKRYFGAKHYKTMLKFISQNHKNITGIYSHNFLTLLVTLSLTFYFFANKANIYLGIAFLCWFTHYMFDILEDLVFLKKINPNWYFRFDVKGIKMQKFSLNRNYDKKSTFGRQH